MIVRTYERACRQFAPEDIIIATDDKRIETACREHGIEQVEMTDPDCRTGTDRVAEVAARYPDVDVWVNIQGDEPLLPDGIVTPLLNKLSSAVAATNGMALIADPEDIASDTIPKVVVGCHGLALYLSRRAIPWHPGWFDAPQYYRQVCVYAFWRKTLARFAELETGPCEALEKIELLRLVEHGYKVGMVHVPGDGISVDIPRDIERVRRKGGWA
jgi:3-deoxy-manno-octulosonate cytidylyltransferase (CMP-KDO synthetase)